MKRLLVFLALILPFGSGLFAQTEIPATDVTLSIFIDCRTNCDLNYFREKVDYVNYVRDRTVADVHVLLTSLNTASGGQQYTILLMGQDQFAGMEQELTVSAAPNQAWDETRKAVAKKLSLGLVPFLLQTEMVDDLQVVSSDRDRRQKKKAEMPQVDPWDYWVFEVSMDGNANLESSRKNYNLNGGLEISRVTDQWRIVQSGYFRLNHQRFIKNEGDIISKLSRYGVYGRTVKSINDHWSFGAFQGISYNNFSNLDLSLSVGPAIEYSVFPYAEAVYKEFTIAYYTRYYYRDYIEETIYGQMEESLWDQSLRVALRLRRPWGSVFSSLEGRHFFHDLSKNSVEFNNRVSVQVIKGLALSLTTNFEFINDQLSLPAGEASLEELLLAQRQLATNYELYLAFGVNYTFGSIFNNVINTRL